MPELSSRMRPPPGSGAAGIGAAEDALALQGLPTAFVIDLALRHFARKGELKLCTVARHLGLPVPLVLACDRHTHLHHAPPQMKANNGIFVIADLDRYLGQPARMTPQALEWGLASLFQQRRRRARTGHPHPFRRLTCKANAPW